MIRPGARLDGGFVAAAHVHPYQSERFEVLEELLGLLVGEQEFVAKSRRGRPRPARDAAPLLERWRGRGALPLRGAPGARFESLIETMFALAAGGKINRKGMPNPLRLAVIAKAHFDTVRLPFPPASMQKLGLALASPLGRSLAVRSGGRSDTGRRRPLP